MPNERYLNREADASIVALFVLKLNKKSMEKKLSFGICIFQIHILLSFDNNE